MADGRTEADELHAVTTRAGTGDDPLDHLAAGAMAFRSPNRTLVAHGVARRVELGRTGGWANDVAAISEALAAIDREGRDGEPASGPVAFCALPFDRRRTAAVTIPRLVRGRDVHGSSWVTTISPANPAAGTTPSPPFPSGRSTNHLATDPTHSLKERLLRGRNVPSPEHVERLFDYWTRSKRVSTHAVAASTRIC